MALTPRKRLFFRTLAFDDGCADAAAGIGRCLSHQECRMGIVPKRRAKRITWYISHANKWAQDPEGLGLTVDEVAELQARTEAARAARFQQQQLQQQARSATLKLKNAIADMSDLGSSLIHRIRAKAEMSGNVNVYVRASMPQPKKKSPIGKPGQPFKFSFQLRRDGTLELRWKCKNPKGSMGTMYHVHRRLEESGESVLVGHVGKKRFLDRTLPAGAKMAVYEVQAIRTTGSGEIGSYMIRFGGAERLPEATPARKAA
jgi:hypothetical protein